MYNTRFFWEVFKIDKYYIVTSRIALFIQYTLVKIIFQTNWNEIFKTLAVHLMTMCYGTHVKNFWMISFRSKVIFSVPHFILTPYVKMFIQI